jgi:hypothetical protein
MPQQVLDRLEALAEALCLDWVHGVDNVHPSTYEDTLVEAACAALRAPVTAPVKAAPRVKPPRGDEETDLTAPDLFSRP